MVINIKALLPVALGFFLGCSVSFTIIFSSSLGVNIPLDESSAFTMSAKSNSDGSSRIGEGDLRHDDHVRSDSSLQEDEQSTGTHEDRAHARKLPIDENTTRDTHDDVQFQKETAVVISTHLIPSHPSLSLLLEVLDSVRTYLVGLPEKCPVFITVDGIREKYGEGKEDKLFLSADKSNREKYDSYIRALHRHFKDEDNVKILIAGKNIGLAENLRRVVENLHPSTKYMYLMQHDLPFAKEINHTAIVKTANEHPEINMVRFNQKRIMGHPCKSVPEINANGIFLKKGAKWSDQNQFARVSHYVNDIFPILSHHNFPEMVMKDKSLSNCTYYGPYYYAKGYGGPWYKHTDATERYGSKLAERVKRGELDVSALSHGNLKEMRRAGVNITELHEIAKTHK